MVFCLKRGFSLIEMMVVVGIMGILLVAGVASYNRLNDRAKVEQAAQLLATELRAIQKQADAGIHGCSSSFQGILVSWNSSQRRISWSDVCDSGSGNSGLTPEQGLGSSGITISMNPPIFTFYSTGRGASERTVFTVRNVAGSIEYLVVVSPVGGIRVEKQ